MQDCIGADKLIKNLLSKRSGRLLGLMAFIATGGGLIISTAINEDNIYKTEILVIYGCFFTVSLIDHFKKLILKDDKNEEK